VGPVRALDGASGTARIHVAQVEDVAMNLNFDPFWRSSVGFDRVLELMDESLRYQPDNNYPPYNILRTGENSYRISLAVAGFKPDQISVTVQQNTLVVTGRENQKTDHQYVHRGIARAISSDASASPTSSRSRMPRSRTGSCKSTWRASCQRR
jgi:hypothetical protein